MWKRDGSLGFPPSREQFELAGIRTAQQFRERPGARKIWFGLRRVDSGFLALGQLACTSAFRALQQCDFGV
jgi:hypothetical protein